MIDSFKCRGGFFCYFYQSSRSPMHVGVGNQMVSGTTLETNMAATDER